MVTKGLLVRLEARPGQEEEVEGFLRAAVRHVDDEPATLAWFAVRFGPSDYGIFEAFADEEGRSAHLAGPVAKSLSDQAADLLAEAPQIHEIDVLADKLVSGHAPEQVTKGLLLTFEPKPGHERDDEEFLRRVQPMVDQEPETAAWFALRLETGHYGIFDAFPDNRGRFAHLTGQVPRELAKHGLSLLGSLPDMDTNSVLAAKLPG